jgi:hypothetical protein
LTIRFTDPSDSERGQRIALGPETQELTAFAGVQFGCLPMRKPMSGILFRYFTMRL